VKILKWADVKNAPTNREHKHQSLEALISAGTEHDDDAVMAIHRGRTDLLEKTVDGSRGDLHTV